ncbi:DUF262 domain-containing protein [uncultured Cyclobacterium sp.]|uniref:DUF262 domain-containing protein n=1 Tax=uncultured Cyclobacterium sp. TaxID=453820 RepID=UPI0030EDABD4|tara:strand:- start:24405 stop:26090 length:1686 start_codon:yes stop_codon:yes gene_type:complete
MQTGKTTLRNIFDGTQIFNVPIYQRAYSWGEENLSEFLSDLINQQPNRTYFLGSYLFHENGKKGDFKIIDIVDGQQRLTTFVIFMRALLLKLEALDSQLATQRSIRIFVRDDDVFKIELSNENSSFLHHHILSDDSTEIPIPKTPSQSLLLAAKSFFTKELSELNKEMLEKIFQVVTEADILIYVVNEINQATQIFELLNDRGKKLTDLEAIKSFLMYSVGLASKNPDQTIITIQQNFGEIYRVIESNQLVEGDILRYHTLAFEQTGDNPKKHIKKKIKGLLSQESDSSILIKTIIEYCTGLKRSFEFYDQINKEKYENSELSKFFMLGRVGPYYPLLFRIYSEDKSKLNVILEKLNDFNFKGIAIGFRGKFERTIYNKLWTEGIQGAIKVLDQAIPGNWWNINNRAIKALDSKYYYGSVNGNLLKYILVAFENSLRSKLGYPKIGLREYYSEIEREKLSIEHITAQKAQVTKFDESFGTTYLHNIGNLVIDNKASNSSKGNKEGGLKSAYFQQAPIMSQNQLLSINCDWDSIDSIMDFISNREILLKDFISKELLKDKLP